MVKHNKKPLRLTLKKVFKNSRLVTNRKPKRYLDWLTLQKEFKYGDGNTQTKQALIISTLKKGFVMEICNIQTQHNIWISFKEQHVIIQ